MARMKIKESLGQERTTRLQTALSDALHALKHVQGGK